MTNNVADTVCASGAVFTIVDPASLFGVQTLESKVWACKRKVVLQADDFYSCSATVAASNAGALGFVYMYDVYTT